MTEKHSGAFEDALASLQTAKDFIATKKLPGVWIYMRLYIIKAMVYFIVT